MTVAQPLITAILLTPICCIWPPPYTINLEESETFIISDLDDYQDEEIMIKDETLNNDDEKYFRIHQMARRYNEKLATDPPRIIKKIKERNFESEEPVPWEAGFVDKTGNFIQQDNDNVYYLNEMAKSLIDEKIEQKRQQDNAGNATDTRNYDYANLQAAYEDEVKLAAKQNDTLNFTEIREDESWKEAVDTMLEFQAKNCSAEENKGIGIAAAKCLWKKLKSPKSANKTLQLLEKVLRIATIWACVYAVIAIPCWCTRGWCCCCCCCRCCSPRRTIEEAKHFFANNPVGVLHTKEGKPVTYRATYYEKYAQKQLEKALMRV